MIQIYSRLVSGFNTQPPEGGCQTKDPMAMIEALFQHTAARRRLPEWSKVDNGSYVVSTHSRPKAAAGLISLGPIKGPAFQHTAARRRLLGG